MSDLILVTGEPSGDLHGAALAQSLLSQKPNLRIGAVAGPRLRALPVTELFPMENLQVMGFSDVLFALPKITRQFFAIRNKILTLNPKAVICVDYPGFNLRLERSLRKHGYKGKLIHYICPTVWAWKKNRIYDMARDLDLLLTHLPFEPACFQNTSLCVKYVGHPLTAAIPATQTPRENILALFPGSRSKEIERNFPLQIAIANRLRAIDPSLQVLVSAAHPCLESPFPTTRDTYSLMSRARLALATSGTVSLELALHSTPTVVHFAIRPIDQFIAQKIFRINLPFYALPNLIAQERIFPELFGSQLTEETLFQEAEKMLQEPTPFPPCEKVRKSLGINDANTSAARSIIDIVDF